MSLPNEMFGVPFRSAIFHIRPTPWQVCTFTWPAGYRKLGVQQTHTGIGRLPALKTGLREALRGFPVFFSPEQLVLLHVGSRLGGAHFPLVGFLVEGEFGALQGYGFFGKVKGKAEKFLKISNILWCKREKCVFLRCRKARISPTGRARMRC